MQALQLEMNESCSTYGASIIDAATKISQSLKAGRAITHAQIKSYMRTAFGGSDAEGCWNWKDAYEAQEAAIVLLLQSKASGIPNSQIRQIAGWQSLALTQTTRTLESIDLQQFSTPPVLGHLAALCCGIRAGDTVLEPSAGTGILAAFAQMLGADVLLNELDERRRSILSALFNEAEIFGFNAEHLHDQLPDNLRPTVVLMNPPFSSSPMLEGRHLYATGHHVRSAFTRLAPGGRLVLISANWFMSGHPVWDFCFKHSPDVALRLSMKITGGAYRKHGTTVDTRLSVIDKAPQDNIKPLLGEMEMTKPLRLTSGQEVQVFRAEDYAQILKLPARCVIEPVKPNSLILSQPVPPAVAAPRQTAKAAKTLKAAKAPPTAPADSLALRLSKLNAVPVAYQSVTATTRQPGESLYEVYQPQRIQITGARSHPTTLCESAALAAVLPPVPKHVPYLPQFIIEQGILSAEQLESVVYAGEAHSRMLRGHHLVSDDWHKVDLSSSATPGAVQFRHGWYLGDGTGAGKGRQVAGIIMDNFCRPGATQQKAVWISISDKLVEDARRDWTALGGSEFDVIALSKFKQGQPITADAGILFTTYATLRSAGKADKASRLQQVVDWLGPDFEGVIAFDEAHSMGNASPDSEGGFGGGKTSLQGVTGVRLQRAVPKARILYASATGATKVNNLAYASRLGLWGTGDFPFTSQAEFVNAINKGGVAAMEIVTRDLKALGLYVSRCLSFDGVEYESLNVELTPEQVEIYDAYARAFMIIHANIDRALGLTNITGETGKCLNSGAKAAIKSLFESCKQRFFNHLLTSMKCPELIRAIERDLANDFSVVIQLVSTSEEMLKRKLATVDVEEWNDLNVDITPRELVMHYLVNAFPVQLYEKCVDAEGKTYSVLVLDADNNPVLCKEAVAQRDELIAQMGSLPPLPSALDHLLMHFGAEAVAEVTGRSIRLLRDTEGRTHVAKRTAGSNLSETQAFMDGNKRILVFSNAGGTGRSYHASLDCNNQQRRKSYLLEAGWRADTAIQGLGRTHRTNQRSAPVFSLVSTNVKGERRFLATIARRLASLGALTRGERQTGGQNLFHERDNLESIYAEAALKLLFMRLGNGSVKCCTLGEFEQATGLNLMTDEGRMKDTLPKIPQFLNRMLALPILMQNQLFEEFEQLLDANIESAIASGSYEVGIEVIRAHQLKTLSTQTVYEHATGSLTQCVEIERTDRNRILSAQKAQSWGDLYIHPTENRAAVVADTTSLVNEKGGFVQRVEFRHPASSKKVTVSDSYCSGWRKATPEEWLPLWEAEVSELPEFITHRFFLICGLLLPIWNLLDSLDWKVYRLTTEAGEQYLGRAAEANQINAIAASLKLSQVNLSAAEIYSLTVQGKQSISLGGSFVIRRSTVKGEFRLEISSTQNSAAVAQQLQAAGCFHEAYR
ncbi:MAG: strawberry notch family protein [Pegethrix bostrychoides GSE-TBD4-15B]|uniref:Strawberry notch family protein n=1 Tax=Pegethrix bostrychoides GSE-TBD4-15B TaxID=2839662 RepID=A0A951PAX8_9CYAN|nr:strawberry notch family protein [Pegethrix bostrychoides GSE-TBD4-15B]